MYVVLVKANVATGLRADSRAPMSTAIECKAVGPFKSIDDANVYVEFWSGEDHIISLEIIDLVAPPLEGR
jgi:hypothetical protein